MLPYLIVPVIVVMSCFIAYLGDHLGRRLGKRRLMLFGMRPKHTAMCITVVTGMLIATGTLGSIMLIDVDVRRALLLFPEVKKDLYRYRHDSEKWECQADLDRATAIKARKALHTSQDSLLAARAKEWSALQEASAAAARSQKEVAKLQRVQALKVNLGYKVADLKSRNQTLTREHGQQLAEIHKLGRKETLLRSQVAERARENKALIQKKQAVGNQLLKEEKQLAQTDQVLGQHRLAVHNELVEWYDSTHNKITFEPDQLIAQGVVDCGAPNAELADQVNAILRRAQEAAREAGAGDSDDPGQLLRLTDPVQTMEALQTGKAPLTHDQVFERFVNSLRLHYGVVVVRIQAVRRCFADDQVVAEISAVSRRLIFHRGEEIASIDVDGVDSEKVIRNEVADFLRTDLRPAAIEAGILPDTHDEISTDVLDKLLTLSHEVHLLQRPAHVEIVAAEDTWCDQPLDLKFRIS